MRQLERLTQNSIKIFLFYGIIDMSLTKKVFKIFFTCNMCYENFFLQSAWKFVYHRLIPSRGGIREFHICTYCAGTKNNAIKRVIEKYGHRGIVNWTN